MFLLNLETQGKYEEAEPLYREAIAIRKQAQGDEHPDLATNLNNLAGLLKAQVSFALHIQIYPFGTISQPLDTDTTGQRARRDSTCPGSPIDSHGCARRRSSRYG